VRQPPVVLVHRRTVAVVSERPDDTTVTTWVALPVDRPRGSRRAAGFAAEVRGSAVWVLGRGFGVVVRDGVGVGVTGAAVVVGAAASGDVDAAVDAVVDAAVDAAVVPG
jgi:hypothetical protein